MSKPGALVTTTLMTQGHLKMKPRIYKKGSVWYCLLNYFNGAGKTPREAFLDWSRLRDMFSPPTSA